MTCWFCKEERMCRPICSTCFDMHTTRSKEDKELIQAVFDHVVWMIGDPDFDDLIKLLKKHPGCWISKKDNHEGYKEESDD